MLVINGTPFFRAKIKQGSLKILEHPLYHEVDTAMEIPSKNNEEEAFDHADLDDSDLDDTDFNLDEEEHEDLDIDVSDEDLSEVKEKKVSAPGSSLTVKSSLEADSKTTVPHTPLSVEEIPLAVVIEVGRIQMSVKKLLELQPGNMLDLNIHPESGVDMVVNGKRIARGELLKIGDSLGIRILELS